MVVSLDAITIRHDLRPGDLGYLIYLHGDQYRREFNYPVEFEAYVVEGVLEFYKQYDPARNRIWICEHAGERVGFLVLLDRGTAAQLRYFIFKPAYRGIGLGKRLMDLFMEFMDACGYDAAFLLTTEEQVSATALYKRYGFVLTRETSGAIFGKVLNEQRYEWHRKA